MDASFIVCRDRLPLTASRVHDTLDAATTEAARLCRKEGATFCVFALVGEVRPAVAPVVWEWKTAEALRPAFVVPTWAGVNAGCVGALS